MSWLDRARLPVAPAAPPDGCSLSVAAWNLMGGLDWTALPVVVEMLGITDVDALVRDLVVIRESQKEP
jgi:hypothetical protein